MYVQIFIPYLFEKLNKKFEERERDIWPPGGLFQPQVAWLIRPVTY
jgi:hypothetical protein